MMGRRKSHLPSPGCVWKSSTGTAEFPLSGLPDQSPKHQDGMHGALRCKAQETLGAELLGSFSSTPKHPSKLERLSKFTLQNRERILRIKPTCWNFVVTQQGLKSTTMLAMFVGASQSSKDQPHCQLSQLFIFADYHISHMAGKLSLLRISVEMQQDWTIAYNCYMWGHSNQIQDFTKLQRGTGHSPRIPNLRSCCVCNWLCRIHGGVTLAWLHHRSWGPQLPSLPYIYTKRYAVDWTWMP